MTERENLIAALDRGTPDYIPCISAAQQITFSSLINNGPAIGAKGGYDWWGVHWTTTESGGGNPTPTVGVPHVLTDITKWREQVKFPDISSLDWAAAAEKDLAYVDPTKVTNFYGMLNGLFERLHFLMGFEEAMCAIMEEPEEVKALVSAIADFYVEIIKKVGKYYKPDYLTFLDDYTYKDGSFISPATFDEIFAPSLKKIVDAVESNGMKYIQHCCGMEGILIDCFYKLGIRRSDPWQPTNDIVALQKKYPDMVFIGGINTQGIVDYPGTTEEDLRAEVRRCIDTYGPQGNYVFYPASLSMYDPAAYRPDGKLGILISEGIQYARAVAAAKK